MFSSKWCRSRTLPPKNRGLVPCHILRSNNDVGRVQNVPIAGRQCHAPHVGSWSFPKCSVFLNASTERSGFHCIIVERYDMAIKASEIWWYL